MCGKAVIPAAVPKPTGCKARMHGNPAEKSGGSFELGVYTFSCSGKPVPVPPPPRPPAPPAPPCAHFNQVRGAVYSSPPPANLALFSACECGSAILIRLLP